MLGRNDRSRWIDLEISQESERGEALSMGMHKMWVSSLEVVHTRTFEVETALRVLI